MAITVIRQPEEFTPAFNDMVFTASSDNEAEPGFLYLVDVYVSATLVARYKVDKDPNYDLLEVDVATAVEGFVSGVVLDPSNTDGIVDQDSVVVNYEVRFGEQYEVAGVTTQFPDLATVSKFAFNGSLTSNEFADFAGGMQENSFNTNAPVVKVNVTDIGCFTGMVETGTTITYLEIKVFDPSGILINTYRVDTALSGLNAYGFASHPATINTIDPSNFILPVAPVVQPIITTSLGSYTVAVVTSGGNFKPVPFEIVDDCFTYTHQTLLFLNRKGGFDSFTFKKVSRESIQTSRKSFKTNPKRLQSDGSYNYTKADRTNVNYLTSTKTSLKLNSDWLSEEESEWLRELITSPEIYLYDSVELVAVQEVRQTNYEVHKDENGEIFNLSIDVLFSADDERQRF